MKRSAPPQRKTPMPSRAVPLQSRTGLAPGRPPERRVGLQAGPVDRAGKDSRETPPQASRAPRKRQSVSPGETAARRTVRARSRGLCEFHGTHLATDYSHRIHASQGGPWTAVNGVDLCHQLHMALHQSRRAEAGDAGLILKSWQDPCTERVFLPVHGGWVTLDQDGGVTVLPVQPPAPDLARRAA